MTRSTTPTMEASVTLVHHNPIFPRCSCSIKKYHLPKPSYSVVYSESRSMLWQILQEYQICSIQQVLVVQCNCSSTPVPMHSTCGVVLTVNGVLQYSMRKSPNCTICTTVPLGDALIRHTCVYIMSAIFSKDTACVIHLRQISRRILHPHDSIPMLEAHIPKTPLGDKQHCIFPAKVHHMN
jgi:hypothetical protein